MATIPDYMIQALLILAATVSFFFLRSFPSLLLSRHRRRPTSSSSSSSSAQSRRHFIAGAQLLSRARSHSPPSQTLIRSALSSADLAIALDPRDAAPLILKSLALALLGRKIPALHSLDAALSPPQSKTLGPAEKADALIKRAELQLEINRRRRVDLAIGDLMEAVRIGGRSARAMAMIGECYEAKGLVEEARSAYEEAMELGGPASEKAIKGLQRVGAKAELDPR